MKKLLPILLLCFLLAAQASAERLPTGAQFYNGTTRPMQVSTLTPLPDGGVVLAGSIRHPGEYRDMPENLGYEYKEDEILVDAAAVCLEPDGTTRWSLRLADPQAENNFYCLGLMPDGRLLFGFGTADSKSFGSQHFIVGTDGIVEEMLSARKLAEIVPPRSLQLLPSGYLSDGNAPVDEVFGSDYPRAAVFLDFDFNELWRIDYGDKPWGAYGMVERLDGYYLGGSFPVDNDHWALSLLKLDRKGDILWEFTEEPVLANTFAWPLLFPPDGGVMFVGTYTPERTPENSGVAPSPMTLTKLDENGKFLWSNVYEDIYIGSAVALGDGYVLCAYPKSDSTSQEVTLLYTDAEGEILGKLPISGSEDRIPIGVGLVAGEDGSVYVYSNLAAPDYFKGGGPWPNVLGFFYAKIDETSFK